MAVWPFRSSAKREDVGAAAERLAAQFLQSRGLQLLARNLRWRDGELDIVMRDGDTLVFVEVRYRASEAFGGAAASVTMGKQRRIVRAAAHYLASEPRFARLPARFDVIAIQGALAKAKIDWLKNAFDAGD